MAPGLAAGVTRGCMRKGFAAAVCMPVFATLGHFTGTARASQPRVRQFSLPHLGRLTGPRPRLAGSVGWVIEQGRANLRTNPAQCAKPPHAATKRDRPKRAARRRLIVRIDSTTAVFRSLLLSLYEQTIACPSRMQRIALVMIVRDEARCLERCLASARPWVDEMVVLDTGSRDGTPEIASAMGARVSHFEWCDDFAAARNAALALTDAAWRLVLDADEWITQGGDCLAALRARERRLHRPDPRREPVRRGRRRGARGTELAVARAAARHPLRRHRPRAAGVDAAAPAPVDLGRARRLSARAEGGEGGPQREAARARARGRPGRPVPALPARQGPRGAVELRGGSAPLRASARACRPGCRVASRSRPANPVHPQARRPLRSRGRPGAGRNGELAGLARLLLHRRRRSARLRGGASRAAPPSCCR